MKGIVFNLLEQAITDVHGEDTWDDLLQAAGLNGVYTSLGTYADDELFQIVDAASTSLDQSSESTVKWFGEQAAPMFHQSYPQFFQKHQSTHPFLMTLNDIIHPEVRKLYPGANVPTFDFEEPDSGDLVMHYHSSRRLCRFAEGLIIGVGKLYRETVDITHLGCMLDGDDRCTLVIRFSKNDCT